MNLELLASGIFLMTAGVYCLECAMRTAVAVEFARAEQRSAQSQMELAWYYRPAEVFLRQVINVRSRQRLWHD